MRKLVCVVVLMSCGGDDKAPTDVVADTARDATDEVDATKVSDAIDSMDAIEDAPPDVVAPPSWQHVGPIVHGESPAPLFPMFVERTAQLPQITLPEGRAMIVDFDGDGREDLVVLGTTASMSPAFLRNATEPGDAFAFEDVSATSGMAGASMSLLVFGDVDNDGDMDAFSGASFRAGANGSHGIWLNDGTGHFTFAGGNGVAPRKATGLLYKEPAAATLADFDGDGVLDLYVAMWNAGDVNGNLGWQTDNELYKGDGTGLFAQFALPDQTSPLEKQVDPANGDEPRRSYGVCPADYDDDGDLDLFVNNYGSGRPALDEPPSYYSWNFLWRNDGNMQFVDVAVPSQVHATVRGIGGVEDEEPVVYNGVTYPGPIGGNGFGCSWGDFDNDGDLDLVVGQIAHPDYPQTDRLLLHVNPGGAPGGARVFGEESAARGLQYYEDELHPVLVDIDNDGRLDLAVSRLRGGSKWEVYMQGQDQRFTMESYTQSGVDIVMPSPTLWLDVDGDGDLDFFMPKDPTGRLYENVAAEGNWLVIDLVGKGRDGSPKDATGARVTLTTGAGKQVRELVGGTGHYNTQQTRRMTFGLGGDDGAADVTIRWPGGETQALGDVKANVHLVVTQGGAIIAR